MTNKKLKNFGIWKKRTLIKFKKKGNYLNEYVFLKYVSILIKILI